VIRTLPFPTDGGGRAEWVIDNPTDPHSGTEHVHDTLVAQAAS
jgi:hypothetical protein